MVTVTDDCVCGGGGVVTVTDDCVCVQEDPGRAPARGGPAAAPCVARGRCTGP